jgi:rare lipoprotein A
VSGTLPQRALWLAGITLVVSVVALAVAHRSSSNHHKIPQAVPVPGTPNGYYTARAAPYGPLPHRRTACGELFTAGLQGVAHPELPCGVKLYVRFNGREVLTEVVDRGPTVPGRDFELTKGLADRIGLHGTQPIEWRYAR